MGKTGIVIIMVMAVKKTDGRRGHFNLLLMVFPVLNR